MRALDVLLAIAFSAGFWACIQGRDLPPIPKQANLAYGPRIYLADTTRIAGMTSPTMIAACTRRAETATSSKATSVMPADGNMAPIDITVPHNCYAKVQPKTLKVDAVEVTDELYRLCADSGACPALDHGPKAAVTCADPARADVCPAVDVSQDGAALFCTWIGRRLPSGLEHAIMRLGAKASGGVPEAIPLYPSGIAPIGCDDAVTGSVCTAPRPVLSNGEPTGGASRDAVTGVTAADRIFDLEGNVSEWAADRFPRQELPWFCKAPLSAKPPYSASHKPVCDAGAVCIYGQYRPAPDLGLGDYPVCLAYPSGVASGADAATPTDGAAFGGSYLDRMVGPETAGTFARVLEAIEAKEAAYGRGLGFRCTGDRAAGVAFEDLPVLQ